MKALNAMSRPSTSEEVIFRVGEVEREERRRERTSADERWF